MIRFISLRLIFVAIELVYKDTKEFIYCSAGNLTSQCHLLLRQLLVDNRQNLLTLISSVSALALFVLYLALAAASSLTFDPCTLQPVTCILP